MRSVKLTIAGLMLLGLVTAGCQRTAEEDVEEMEDTTAVVVPDTAAADTLEGAEAEVEPTADRPDKEIVIVREREARPAPRREEVREPEPVREPPREEPREEARPATATIPAGTNFFVTTETELSTKANQVGDPVAARTAENINVDGQVVIPAGALVEGHVTAVETAGNPGEIAYIDLTFDRVRLADGEWLPISGALAGKAGQEVRGSANIPRNVAIGAGAGAVLGQVIGGDTKSTVIGAVIGAGAGAAAGEATRDTYVVVPAGSRLNVQLTSPVQVRAG